MQSEVAVFRALIVVSLVLLVDISMVLWGAALAMAYYSDLRSRFERAA